LFCVFLFTPIEFYHICVCDYMVLCQFAYQPRRLFPIVITDIFRCLLVSLIHVIYFPCSLDQYALAELGIWKKKENVHVAVHLLWRTNSTFLIRCCFVLFTVYGLATILHNSWCEFFGRYSSLWSVLHKTMLEEHGSAPVSSKLKLQSSW